MKPFLQPRLASLFCLALLAGAPGALHAQATKIFVASFGNDANDGSRGSPKRNFQAAHDGVAAGGEIVVLDTAGYGRLSITKSLAVTVPPGVNGFITATGADSGVRVFAGPADVVSLRGLVVEGGGKTAGGIGIALLGNVGNLVVEDCTVRNFQSGVTTRSALNTQLGLHRSVVRGCGVGLELGVQSGAVAGCTAVVTDSRLEANSDGVFTFPGGSGSVDVTLTGCTITGNSLAGVVSNGVGSVVRVSNCTVTANGIGATTLGGQLFSRGNNTSEKNNSGNGFPATYSAR